jgi:hypothetical protein
MTNCESENNLDDGEIYVPDIKNLQNSIYCNKAIRNVRNLKCQNA